MEATNNKVGGKRGNPGAIFGGTNFGEGVNFGDLFKTYLFPGKKNSKFGSKEL